MVKIVSIIWAFILSQMIFGFLYSKYGLSQSGFGIFFQEPSSVPMVILTTVPFLQCIVIYLCIVYLRNTSPRDQIFPCLWIDEKSSLGTTILCEKISAISVIAIPWIGLLYYWMRFHRGKAWRNDLVDPKVVSLYDWTVPPSNLLIDFNAYRYGISPGLGSDENGVSFVPFWQPVFLMGGGTIFALILSSFIIRQICIRLPLRRR